jgi:hypothetical protein
MRFPSETNILIPLEDSSHILEESLLNGVPSVLSAPPAL